MTTKIKKIKKNKAGKPRYFEFDLSRGALAEPSPLPSPASSVSLGRKRLARAESIEGEQQHQQQQPESVLKTGLEYVSRKHHRRRTSSVGFIMDDSGAGTEISRLLLPPAKSTVVYNGNNDVERQILVPDIHKDESDDSGNDGDDDDDDDEDNDNITQRISVSVKSAIEDGWQDVKDVVKEQVAEFEEKAHYDWTEFYKSDQDAGPLRGIIRFTRWLATGLHKDAKQTDDDIQENLKSLARLLSLLREYHERFGMPSKGGPKDQEYVLREVTKDLYKGGSPIWVLEPVMKRVAEGLTGRVGIEFFMLPRRCFMFDPSSGGTHLIRTVRGYDMQRLDAMESIAVRLASFASNTGSTSSVPARFPHPSELREAYRTESLAGYVYDKDEMAEEILNLASEAEGLFFYINSRHEKAAARGENADKMKLATSISEFWTVGEPIKELFSRLAAIEAVISIDKIDVERKALYSNAVFSLFRFAASAGACAFWFGGSWVDILVSGTLALLVARVEASPLLSQHERIIFEAVGGLLVGLVSGLITLAWPQHTCFGAMALSGVLDLLQGSRVVYAVMGIMRRHTIAGGADFLEGLFFTALIAYFLKFGHLAAISIMGEAEDPEHQQCTKGVHQMWNFLFVPLAAFSWSGLFNPQYLDMIMMAAHGILGYIVSMQYRSDAPSWSTFVAAMAVTFSAGVVSRFTGRQALGNTIAGIYVLMPGAYMMDEMYNNAIENFLSVVIMKSIIIGIGAWTGTILCSPTLLGTNRGFIQNSPSAHGASMMAGNFAAQNDDVSRASGSSSGSWRKREKKGGGGAPLFIF